jgi:SAM-dependent methyltransferase
MSFGRRQVSVADTASWVFNRMVGAYSARPAYPLALIEALELAARGQRRVLDLGAGLGHVALPMAARGLSVTAVEPARLMLDRLSELASREHLSVRTLHAKAEALPVPNAAFDLTVVADALHFLDVELVADEIDRVLAPAGALVVLTVAYDDTPFMRSVRALVDSAAVRRPRNVSAAIQQLFRLTRTRPEAERVFVDATAVDAERLEQILQSISFVGPAMNAERFAAFRKRIRELPYERVWARRLTLHVARASARRRARPPSFGAALTGRRERDETRECGGAQVEPDGR